MVINIAIGVCILIFISVSAYQAYLIKKDDIFFDKWSKEREFSSYLQDQINEMSNRYKELEKEYNKLKNEKENTI